MTENKIIIPTVGRRVWFRCGETFANRNGLFKSGDQPMDAGIVYVHSDTCVNLLVADHMGVTKALTSVLLVQPGTGQTPMPDHYCEWMPYQVGQAKKDAEPDRGQIGLPVRDTMRNEDVIRAEVSGGTVAAPAGPTLTSGRIDSAGWVKSFAGGAPYASIQSDGPVLRIDDGEDTPANPDELERLRMQLAACGVAAMANTRDSFKKQRLPLDSPYRSASYGDVLNAVEREIDERERADEMAERNIALAHELHELAKSKDALRAELDALRKMVRGEESSRPDGIVVLPKGVSIKNAVLEQAKEFRLTLAVTVTGHRDGEMLSGYINDALTEIVNRRDFKAGEIPAGQILRHDIDFGRVRVLVDMNRGHGVATARQDAKAAGGQAQSTRRDYVDGEIVGVSSSACPDEVVAEHGFTLYEAVKALGHPVQEDLKRITLVVQVLDNGHVVVGQSACADIKAFTRSAGEHFAREAASAKVAELLAFRKRDNASTWAKAYGKA